MRGLALAAIFTSAIAHADPAARRAAAAPSDGILVVRANPAHAWNDDGFRQDPVFYGLTGLENAIGALLIVDGKTHESWLFSSEKLDAKGIEHVATAKELPGVLKKLAARKPVVAYLAQRGVVTDFPTESDEDPKIPLWVREIAEGVKGKPRDASAAVNAVFEVQDEAEKKAVRAAGKASAAALMAGLKATKVGTRQRLVEAEVVRACWAAGVHGTSFWPWAMSGANGAFPRPLESLGRYDHLDKELQAGELVRLDVGCEAEHFQGDVGRTIPASGRFDAGQREVWTMFVAAYRTGAAAIKPGATGDSVFAAWLAELERQLATAKTDLGKKAAAQWRDKASLPFWELHTTGLVVALPSGPLKEGTTVDLEPIAVVDGQGFYLEDMYLVTKDGAENVTPGLPTTADEIEAAMK